MPKGMIKEIASIEWLMKRSREKSRHMFGLTKCYWVISGDLLKIMWSLAYKAILFWCT